MKYFCLNTECNFASSNISEAHEHNNNHIDHVMAQVEADADIHISAQRFGETIIPEDE